MRVALDSSVLIAAAISRAGVCAALLEDILTAHELVVSPFILDEVTRKLRDKFRFPDADIRRLRRFLRNAARVVTPTDLPPDACRDPMNVPVLGTAVAGNAPLLVTVDNDLLAIGCFQGISIIRPREFWAQTTTGCSD